MLAAVITLAIGTSIFSYTDTALIGPALASEAEDKICFDKNTDPSSLTPEIRDYCMALIVAEFSPDDSEFGNYERNNIANSRYAFPTMPAPALDSDMPNDVVQATFGDPTPNLRKPTMQLSLDTIGSNGVIVTGVSDEFQFNINVYSGNTYETSNEEHAAFIDTTSYNYGTTIAMTGRWLLDSRTSIGASFTTPPLGADEEYSYGESFLGSSSDFFRYTDGYIRLDSVDGAAFGLDQLSFVYGWNLSIGELGVAMPWMDPDVVAETMMIGSASLGNWRLDLFYMQLPDYEDSTHLMGSNLVWFLGDRGALSASYVNAVDSDDFHTLREGVEAYAVRGEIAPIRSLPELSISGEYVALTGIGQYLYSYDATGWSLRASYAAYELPMIPIFTYRYSQLSGETDYFDKSWSDFDNLFLSQNNFRDGHYNGNLSSLAMDLFGNRAIHELRLELAPTPNMYVSASYFRFDLLENDILGSYSSTHLGDELNLQLGWYDESGASLAAWYDVAIEGPAQQEFFGFSSFGPVYHSFGLQFSTRF